MEHGAMRGRPLADRLLAQITVGDECWEWLGGDDGGGYGRIQRGAGDPRKAPAHVIAYELLVGPIPEGLELDHLCRNRRCVRTSHLEPVTHAVNMSRGAHARKTHCPQGHPYDEMNTVRLRQGRGCRSCIRTQQRITKRRREGVTAPRVFP